MSVYFDFIRSAGSLHVVVVVPFISFFLLSLEHLLTLIPTLEFVHVICTTTIAASAPVATTTTTDSIQFKLNLNKFYVQQTVTITIVTGTNKQTKVFKSVEKKRRDS